MGFQDWINDPGNAQWLGTLGAGLSSGHLENLGPSLFQANAARTNVYEQQRLAQLEEQRRARQMELQRRQDSEYQRAQAEREQEKQRRAQLAQSQREQLDRLREAGVIKPGSNEDALIQFNMGTPHASTFMEDLQTQTETKAEQQRKAEEMKTSLLPKLREVLPPETVAAIENMTDAKSLAALRDTFVQHSMRDTYDSRDDERRMELERLKHQQRLERERLESQLSPSSESEPSNTDVNRVLRAVNSLPKVGEPKGDSYDSGKWTEREVDREREKIRRAFPEIYERIVPDEVMQNSDWRIRVPRDNMQALPGDPNRTGAQTMREGAGSAAPSRGGGGPLEERMATEGQQLGGSGLDVQVAVQIARSESMTPDEVRALLSEKGATEAEIQAVLSQL